MAVHQRFAGDPTLLVQVLAAHITSPTCIENCADRKHAQKRIVKHVDLLLDLRALWSKLTFCQSTMTELDKQKRQDRESEREHEKQFKETKRAIKRTIACRRTGTHENKLEKHLFFFGRMVNSAGVRVQTNRMLFQLGNKP